MSPEQQSGTERVEWRVVGSGGAIYPAESLAEAQEVAVFGLVENESAGVIQRRTVVESPWSDVDEQGREAIVDG